MPKVFCLHVNIRVNDDESIDVREVSVTPAYKGACPDILKQMLERIGYDVGESGE